jgi:hypothetical protein
MVQSEGALPGSMYVPDNLLIPLIVIGAMCSASLVSLSKFQSSIFHPEETL